MTHPFCLPPVLSNQGHHTVFEYAAGFCAAFMGALILTREDQLTGVLFLGIGFSILIALRHPIIIILAHFFVFILPSVLLKYFDHTTLWDSLFQGVHINDIIWAVMFSAIIIRLATIFFSTQMFKKKKPSDKDIKLGICITGLCLWFLYEIARNFDTYGLSAAGEFRSHYLLLIVPVYIAVFFDSPQKRKTLFKTTLFLCFIFPLLCIPTIGLAKGWAIGANNRFFPAGISFGILQGIFFCSLCNKHGYIKMPSFFQWTITLAALLLIIFDTHRSVWFSAIIMLFVYIRFDQITFKHSFNKIIGGVLLFSLLCILGSATANFMLGKDLFEFIAERGGDLFILDESYDSTWTWRIARWKMEMGKIVDSPLTGIGFGGYWGQENLLEKSGIVPHNLYIQILVKLGIIGLCLYLMIIARVFQRLYNGISILKANHDPEYILAIAGIIALIGSHTYYMAYSFDEYSFFFIGLAMAVLRFKTPELKGFKP